MDEKKLLAALAVSIRGRRKRAGLTIAQLAELAGIDPGFLAYIETAKKTPSLITASKIASALRIPLSELFESAPKAEPELEYRLERQIYSLFHERSASQVAELMEILKKLRDPARVSALRRIIGK